MTLRYGVQKAVGDFLRIDLKLAFCNRGLDFGNLVRIKDTVTAGQSVQLR